jgi:hypothetical protein
LHASMQCLLSVQRRNASNFYLKTSRCQVIT